MSLLQCLASITKHCIEKIGLKNDSCGSGLLLWALEQEELLEASTILHIGQKFLQLAGANNPMF